VISPFLTRSLPKLGKLVQGDPQRVRFYKMEREFIGTVIYHKVGPRDLQTVADHACNYYRIKPIRIVVYDKPKERKFGESVCFSADGRPDFGFNIRLNRGFHGANIVTLLHELAHYIVDDTYEGHDDHGEEFIGVYMHLLGKYRIIPSDAFRVIAKRHRIKIAGKFKPGAIRG
jgi:hypothetical protein